MSSWGRKYFTKYQYNSTNSNVHVAAEERVNLDVFGWYRQHFSRLNQCHFSGTPYMLSLPHSAGDSRNYRKSPALPRGRNNLPQFHRNKWKKLREHPALYGFQSTQNKQIVRNLPYWVRIIGLFLAGHCLKCFSE